MDTNNKIKAKKIAKIIHSATRVLGRHDNTPVKPWKKLSKESRDLAIKAVEDLMDQPARSPKELHDVWQAGKVESGWVYGEQFNFENKTHPSIVEFESLPVSEKIKDEIWGVLIEVLRPYYDKA